MQFRSARAYFASNMHFRIAARLPYIGRGPRPREAEAEDSFLEQQAGARCLRGLRGLAES